ncbi:polysaccharide deacetylase family protein [Cognaticolwellia aestuarii]|uniref:polysaccharide deacetylase family protein n=1 Tax=Cognaticolwellia aestuarii TaxID=329993 RepID=UPI00098558C7|nr:polysaccharide deacetylase family protein [Cognaticolwellia aestuarii]
MLTNVKYKLGKLIANAVLPNGLYCFNYHRIGEASLTEYDPNVFSCDEANFAEHMQYIKKHFTVVTLDDLDEILKGKITDKRYALITFDDGYIDNYSKAFPILLENKISATFFLATNFINNAEIPWWDRIAYLVRHAQVDEIKLNNWPDRITLSKEDVPTSIRKVLDVVKINNGSTIEEILIELHQKLQTPNSNFCDQEPLFMTWDMAREMSAAGMEFGSQTCSHRILSHLSIEEQDYEAKTSKELIEKELNTSIKAFAYPVGGKDSFTAETVKIIKKYYQVSFSFISGINTSKQLNEFSIERISVDSNCNATQLSHKLLKLYLKKLHKSVWK